MSRPSVTPIGAATSVKEFALEVATGSCRQNSMRKFDRPSSAPGLRRKAKRRKAKYRKLQLAKTDSASLLRPGNAPLLRSSDDCGSAPDVAAEAKIDSASLLRPGSAPLLRSTAKYAPVKLQPEVAADAKTDSASSHRPGNAPLLRSKAKYAPAKLQPEVAAEAKTDSASLLHLGSATRRRSKAKYAPVKLQPIPKAQGLVNVRKKVKEERRAASIEQVKAELDRLASVLEEFKT